MIEYRYKDKYTVVEDLCLISNSKIEKLKPLLIPGITYNEVSIIFTKNDVPEFCHRTLIRKLGFEFDWRVGENKYDYRNPTIFKRI